MATPAGRSAETAEQISLSVARAEEESALPPPPLPPLSSLPLLPLPPPPPPPLSQAKISTRAPSLVAYSRTASSVEASIAAWLAARTTPNGSPAVPSPPPPLPSSTAEQLLRVEARRAQSPQVHRRAQRSFEAWAWTRGQQERQSACTALRDAARASSLVETGGDCWGAQQPREGEDSEELYVICFGLATDVHQEDLSLETPPSGLLLRGARG